LHDRKPAAALDGAQPGGAVGQRTRQQHADHPAAEAGGGRAEQRVDRRPRMVLARAAAQQDMVVVQQQMHARDSDIDAAALERHAASRRRDRQGAAAIEDGSQDTALADMKVAAGRSPGRPCRRARLDRPSRAANDDDVAGWGRTLQGRSS
jgi:hypothetical protein